MNDIERKEFWDVLCSLDGKDIDSDDKLLRTKIIMPQYLCRYRSVNSNNLEALRTNKIYFSKANKYDDPFDTYLYFDIDKIAELFESNFVSKETVDDLARAMNQFIKSVPNNIPIDIERMLTTREGLLEIHKSGITDAFLSYLMGMRTMMQDKIISACFSENCFNETLWLKYADNHKGFALVYDYNNQENFRCGRNESCKECLMYKYGAALLPVYYSNDPYDATNVSQTLIAQEMENKMQINVPDFIKNTRNDITWDIRRCSLIKKECHKYDQEWRMLPNFELNPPWCIEWVPDMVIIGLRTSEVDTKLIISMAKEAGIKKIYKSIIGKDNKLCASSIN